MKDHQAFLPDTDAAALPDQAGPGRRLRQAREAHGLTREQVAADLHLKLSLVAALEQDRFEDLPGQVFVTGYLRNYARLLGLDSEPLIQAYRAVHRPTESPVRRRVTGASRRQIGSGHLIIRLISATLAIGIVTLLLLWWQNSHIPIGFHETAEIQDEATLTISDRAMDDDVLIGPAPAIDDGLLTSPAPASPIPDELVESRLESDSLAAATVDEEPRAPAPDETALDQDRMNRAAPIEPSEATTSRVELAFDGPCWVDIRDATREFKLFGEMAKGDHRVLEGTPPWSMIIGNAAAVTIRIDGEPFDLASRARGNVARFTLDPTTNQ